MFLNQKYEENVEMWMVGDTVIQPKKKSNAWKWILAIIAIVVIGTIALVVLGLIFLFLLGAGLFAAGEASDYSNDYDSDSYTSPLTVSASSSASSAGSEECEFDVSGTVSNPNSESVSGVEVSCIATLPMGSGSMYHGSGSEDLGTISGEGSKSFDFTFTGWRYSEEDSCSRYVVDCEVDY